MHLTIEASSHMTPRLLARRPSSFKEVATGTLFFFSPSQVNASSVSGAKGPFLRESGVLEENRVTETTHREGEREKESREDENESFKQMKNV